MNKSDLSELDSLLPFNSSELEQTIEQIHATRLGMIPVPIPTLWQANTCPEPLLPWLAWALSVENWDSDWDESIKRDVIAASIANHQQKGTLASVRRVLEAIRVRFELEEWFEYDGEPYTFRLSTSANAQWEQGLPVADAEVYNTLRTAVDSVKPVRSHYRTFVTVDTESELALGNTSQVLTRLQGQLTPRSSISATSVLAAAVVSTVKQNVSLSATLTLPPNEQTIVSKTRLQTLSILQPRFQLSNTLPFSNTTLSLTPTATFSLRSVLLR